MSLLAHSLCTYACMETQKDPITIIMKALAHGMETEGGAVVEWFRRLTRDPEVTGSIPARLGVVSLGKTLYSYFPHSTQVYKWVPAPLGKYLATD